MRRIIAKAGEPHFRMKKIGMLIGVVLLAVVCFNKSNAANIALGSATATLGVTPEISISADLSPGSGEEVAALQFDVDFSAANLVLDRVTVGTAAETAGKGVEFGAISDSKVRILVYGTNQNIIGQGRIAQLIFKFAPTAVLGVTPLTTNGIVVCDVDAGVIPGDGTNGAISIEEGDVTSPIATITSHTNNQIVTSSPVTVTGTALDEYGSTIMSVEVNGIAATTADGYSTWSANGVGLVEGNNSIIVATEDEYNNSDESAVNINIILDTTPPETLDHLPVKGSTGNSRNTNILATIKDSDAGVDVASIVMTVEGVAVVPSISGMPAEYILTYNSPVDFSFGQVINVTIEVSDLAVPANVMPQDSYSFTIVVEGDIIPPLCSNGQPSGTLPLGTTQVNISLNTDEQAICKYSTTAGTTYDNMPNTFNSTNSAEHSTLITGLGNGQTYTYYVRAEDISGNANTDDYIITFSVGSDNVPPTATIVSPGNNQIVSSSPITVTGTAVDAEGSAIISVRVNGIAATTTNGYSTWSAGGIELVEGDNSVVVATEDENNNTDELAVSINVVLDTTVPITLEHLPAKESTENSRETNISVTIRDNGAGVDLSSIVMTVEGTAVVPSISGTSAEYILTYDPPVNFSFGQEVNITIDAADLVEPANVMIQEVYFFSVEERNARIPFTEDLSWVKVYPNPYNGSSSSGITFNFLTEGSKIKIYTLSGQLVKEIEVGDEGRVIWSGKNEEGKKIVSGIYLYLIVDEKGNKKSGKVAIVK